MAFNLAKPTRLADRAAGFAAGFGDLPCGAHARSQGINPPVLLQPCAERPLKAARTQAQNGGRDVLFSPGNRTRKRQRQFETIAWRRALRRCLKGCCKAQTYFPFVPQNLLILGVPLTSRHPPRLGSASLAHPALKAVVLLNQQGQEAGILIAMPVASNLICPTFPFSKFNLSEMQIIIRRPPQLVRLPTRTEPPDGNRKWRRDKVPLRALGAKLKVSTYVCVNRKWNT